MSRPPPAIAVVTTTASRRQDGYGNGKLETPLHSVTSGAVPVCRTPYARKA